MFKTRGFTLAEILVVVVIIGTLAALAWPNYSAIKEKALNKEANASLALIRAAEKIYKMEQGYYYPYLTTTNVIANINSFLKLSLPESATRMWTMDLDGNTVEHSTATRTGVGADGRQWTINFPGDKAVCSGSAACP
ncbi:MAG: type II secretion system protein [Candidatus Omnitrophota bacterium]